MTTPKYPNLTEAILALGKTHAERAAAMGISERTYYEYLSGNLPMRSLKPFLTNALIEALRADLSAPPAEPEVVAA